MTLHVLFVINANKSWLTVSRIEVDDAFREIGRDTSEQLLREVESAATDTDIELVTEAFEGTPDERILAYATEGDVDPVVMGTHGRTRIEHRLLGSVTEQVIRRTDVPVRRLCVTRNAM